MAVHILTALRLLQWEIDTNQVNWDHLKTALEHPCWTEDLTEGQRQRLVIIQRTNDLEELKRFVAFNIGYYSAIWHSLDEPYNREQWLERRYR
jgi:hypothetical protein